METIVKTLPNSPNVLSAGRILFSTSAEEILPIGVPWELLSAPGATSGFTERNSNPPPFFV